MISSMASHKDKTFKLLSDNNLTAPLEEYNTPTDWNMCVFCEKDTVQAKNFRVQQNSQRGSEELVMRL